MEVSVTLTEWDPMGSICKDEILSKLKSVATDFKTENASAFPDHYVLEFFEEKFHIQILIKWNSRSLKKMKYVPIFMEIL